MRLLGQPIDYDALPGTMPVWHRHASAEELIAFSHAVRRRGGRLISLWGSDERDRGKGFGLYCAFAVKEGLALLQLALEAAKPTYPDLSGNFRNAIRLQRALYDLLGLRADTGYGGTTDTRPLLRHSQWPADYFPLRRDCAELIGSKADGEDYAFVPVDGDGVHEMAVGPIHDRIAEAGHYRLSTLGESVIRMEQRLGYKHKAIDKRFTQLTLNEGHRLAGRVCGDSTVAYAWAYAMALESIAGATPPTRALWLRALLLERERVANHLGDLGSVAGEAGFSFGFVQFMRLKEDWLRLNARAFGHRHLMDRILPGGVCCDMNDDMRLTMHAQCNAVEREVKVLRRIYDDHSGLQDRFLATGRIAPELAAELGMIGPAGRASGQSWDLRIQHPTPPYDELDIESALQRNGDVAARVIVRFEEILESLHIIRHLADHMVPGETRVPLAAPAEGALGIGWVEGWRGEVFMALEAGSDGAIRRCHCCDPSWHNRPAVEDAVAGHSVPDVPLIDKSFNLSCSGQDL